MLYKFAIQILHIMKLISSLFLFVVLAVSNQLLAQEWTLLGGLNFSNQSAKDNYVNHAKEDEHKTRIAMHLGILLDIPLTDNFSVESGLMYKPKGYKLVANDGALAVTLKSKPQYLELPILAKYKYSLNDNMSLYGMIGPTLGFAIAGGFTYIEKANGEKAKDHGKLKFGTTRKSDYKRLDFSLMIGAGLTFSKIRTGFFYQPGLINVAPHSFNGYKSKTRVFGLSIGYILKSN